MKIPLIMILILISVAPARAQKIGDDLNAVAAAARTCKKPDLATGQTMADWAYDAKSDMKDLNKYIAKLQGASLKLTTSCKVPVQKAIAKLKSDSTPPKPKG